MTPSRDHVTVADRAGLLAALAGASPLVRIRGRIADLPPLTLAAGQSIEGEGEDACLAFGGDGVRLSGGNTVARLLLAAPPGRDALALAGDGCAPGTITIEDVACIGAVRLLFRGGEASVSDVPVTLVVRALDIIAADTVSRLPRPAGNGVEVQQGAFTVWNTAPGVDVTLDVADLSAGRRDAPVRGCGVFVAGDTPAGATVKLQRFATGEVHSDSTLSGDVTQTVSGGVFILGGVVGDTVESAAIVTHGANCVPVDTWAEIGLWTVTGRVVSHGPSAVGFVNAGTLGELRLMQGIETFGEGARACCIYGPTGRISANGIVTHGRAASAVQVVSRLGTLIVDGAIVTHGTAGEGLVKGHMVPAYADAVHVEAGGAIGSIVCAAIEIRGGDALQIRNEGAIGGSGGHSTGPATS